MTFGWSTIRENDDRLNKDSGKCRSALWSFANSTIRPCDDSVKWLLAIFFGKTTIRRNCISAKRRFGKMMWPRQQLDYWSDFRPKVKIKEQNVVLIFAQSFEATVVTRSGLNGAVKFCKTWLMLEEKWGRERQCSLPLQRGRSGNTWHVSLDRELEQK